MRKTKKVLPFIITLAILVTPLVFVIGRSTYWDRFIGSTHNVGCHGGTLTKSTTGYLELTLNTSSTVSPNAVFIVNVKISLFSEAANLHPEVIFNNNTASGRVRLDSNNSLFYILYPLPPPYYKPLLDAQGSYTANDLNFTLRAPATSGSYTLRFDAIEGERDTGSANPIFWVEGVIGITVASDNPPSLSNIVAVFDPLEGGNTQVVRANATDDNGVNSVKVEFDGTNHSMIKQSGDMWEYSSWTPATTGVKTYTIYATDTIGQVTSSGGSFTVSDTIAPSITNVVTNASVIELGDTERIWANVTDWTLPIASVKIEIAGSNYTMTLLSGDMWEYVNWQPNAVGTNTFKIWASDTQGNWNFVADSVTGQDTIPPTYSNLIESADPLPLGQNETIWIDVFDSPGSGVALVKLFYEGSNHTMQQVGNTWSWSNWQPVSVNTFPYTIYMLDNQDNVATTAGSITTEVGSGPILNSLVKIPEPLELGQAGYIRVNATDASGVSLVFLEFSGVNHTMTRIGLTDMYEYVGWSPAVTGSVPFKIYANNTGGSWSSLTSSYLVQDTTAPTISNLWESAPTIELGLTETIQVDITDLSLINQVRLERDGLNYTMSFVSGNLYEYTWAPFPAGTKTYKIWGEDNHGNWNFLGDSITIQDTIEPNLFGLWSSAPVIELGLMETIRINVTDLSPITSVRLEYASANHTMSLVAPASYEYNWPTSSYGLNNFKIWAGDNQGNWNMTLGSITTTDTTPPIWNNLVVNNPTIDLGSTVSISIDTSDSPGTGVATVKIEYDGTNHTMSPSGNTWSWTSWKPTAAGSYAFTIYALDGQSNVVSTAGNIQVNAPSSGNPNDGTPTPPPENLTYTLSMVSAGIAGIIAIGVMVAKPKKIKGGKRGMRRLRFPLR